MSEKENRKQVKEESPEESPRVNELTEQELKEANGGWGDIKGGSSDDKHKDWSE
jgi:hypothetical protein